MQCPDSHAICSDGLLHQGTIELLTEPVVRKTRPEVGLPQKTHSYNSIVRLALDGMQLKLQGTHSMRFSFDHIHPSRGCSNGVINHCLCTHLNSIVCFAVDGMQRKLAALQARRQIDSWGNK